jgi:hypothetical protein
MKTMFEVVVRSLVGPSPGNVVRLLVDSQSDHTAIETLLSSRDARELARMLVESADQADELGSASRAPRGSIGRSG